MKTLLVDDQHDDFDFQFTFKRPDIDIDFAADGEAAITAVQNCHYDLVLMDGNLLGGERWSEQMQGPDVVRKIRTLNIIQPKIFMCTTDQDMQKRGVDAGADGVVDKALLIPLNWDAILAIINN